jgi:hypothetical protein
LVSGGSVGVVDAGWADAPDESGASVLGGTAAPGVLTELVVPVDPAPVDRPARNAEKAPTSTIPAPANMRVAQEILCIPASRSRDFDGATPRPPHR